MSLFPRRSLSLTAGVLLSACATVPTGPSVMVLPGTRETFEQFARDDSLCREWAAGRTGTTTNRAAAESGVTGAALATAIGAAAGAAIGGAVGEVGEGAAIGAGSGLLLGSAAGAARGGWAAATVQERYDAAYLQCMYASGHQIPVPAATARALDAHPAAPPATRPPRHIPPPPSGPPPPPPPTD